MHILITGGAGFIGAALGHRLLDRGDTIHAIDSLNDYYEVSLKEARLARLSPRQGFQFDRVNIADRETMASLFENNHFDVVVNLAAQAGVRYSLENPAAYVDANLVGFGNILEGCRHSQVGHLVYASSSSVYGGNTKLPFSEDDPVDHPVSLYAATKKANELMAHTYAHLYQLPCTGLRFFTVYGPWGRPDMAFFKFTRAMLAGESIPVYNHGQLTRDFTYIDDIVEGIIRVVDQPATPDPEFDASAPTPAASQAPARVLNIGNGNRVQLMDYIATLESCLGVKAEYDMMPMQSGDVMATHADVERLRIACDYQPSTDIKTGLARFCEWYREYYNCPRI
ncbi:MAG: NAD-dependent epimerase [Acidiferrobacterales bacterium]|nr:NAD-dependent epimerase [Acidiferrobacterales bacterium]